MRTLILALVAFAAANSQYYVLEKLDMDLLVKNLDELKIFTNCLLEKIPCNKVHESYRVKTLEAVQEACKKCNPHTKHMFWEYLQALKADLPKEYIEFRHKYDPDNKYFDIHEAEISKYAIE
ncbi:ejaculatory bulb-specific protein 3-like [Danaus plexippus]|uniref:ejaculatory bulb-specific protein 3-like n=1 Tax=Danaus plexippus TaxID=13037 RepID=UPI0013C48D19|nr:ejaculatory bulb-specific protein 3-like [Danaus plexippus]XP_032519988.1 ejaculatory bulb-specific protein 3-like [Danaus plexippus]